MKTLRKTIAALLFALLPAAVFADSINPEPDPNDYIPFISYLAVGVIGIVIIIAMIIIARKIIRRRKK